MGWGQPGHCVTLWSQWSSLVWHHALNNWYGGKCFDQNYAQETTVAFVGCVLRPAINISTFLHVCECMRDWVTKLGCLGGGGGNNLGTPRPLYLLSTSQTLFLMLFTRDDIARGCWCVREMCHTGLMQMQWGSQELLWAMLMCGHYLRPDLCTENCVRRRSHTNTITIETTRICTWYRVTMVTINSNMKSKYWGWQIVEGMCMSKRFCKWQSICRANRRESLWQIKTLKAEQLSRSMQCNTT